MESKNFPDIETVLEVKDLSKKFCANLKRSMLYGSNDLIRSFLNYKTNESRLRKSEFWALQDINFKLSPGETIGLVGTNGSGKSTLLRIINGIYLPDRGEVRSRGKIGSLIALGAGFHPHMSGRENVKLNGTLLGMTTEEIDDKLESIIRFADIGDFLEAPVATYSSGMSVRLGFSIAIHSTPDILLVDEVLAVGDLNFQKKCFEKIIELKNKGVATIMVSHSVAALERLCDRGVLINHGRQLYDGPMYDCIKEYSKVLNSENQNKAQLEGAYRGLGNVDFSNIKVYQENRPEKLNEIEFAKSFVIEFDYEFKVKESNGNQIRITILSMDRHEIQKFIIWEKGFGPKQTFTNEKSIELNKNGHIKLKVKNPRFFPQTLRVDIAIVRIEHNMHEGVVMNAANFKISEPTDSKMYFEYGNMSVTEFDYEIAGEAKPEIATNEAARS